MLFSKILRHGHDSLVSPGSQVGRDGSGDHTRIRILIFLILPLKVPNGRIASVLLH
jgi:hypothetical protein